ncbi:hypothetical protein D3C71_1759240 [compost metagenome]
MGVDADWNSTKPPSRRAVAVAAGCAGVTRVKLGNSSARARPQFSPPSRQEETSKAAEANGKRWLFETFILALPESFTCLEHGLEQVVENGFFTGAHLHRGDHSGNDRQ